jgi:hypothetical protein
MTVDVAAIVHERLNDWGKDCIRDHATPALLLAIGHDHVSGEAHLYVPDDPAFDNKMIRSLLMLALRELDNG